MRQVVVISGKGGTGKTSITGCFAALETRLAGRSPVTVDCDVDAPNLHLLLGGRVVGEETFSGPKLAVIDRSKIAEPAACDRSCPFGAITGCEVDPLKCVGCGVCALVCGTGAVTMTDRPAATIFERQTPYGRFFHARLRPGQPGFGGLVTALRMKGEQIAVADPGTLLLLDGSPGLGCRVIASVSGCDLALVVTEPGLGALADLERVCRLLDFFRMKTMIVINRYDLDRSLARDVERFSADNGLPVAGKIPYDEVFRAATVAQKPAVELATEDLRRTLEALYHRVREVLYE